VGKRFAHTLPTVGGDHSDLQLDEAIDAHVLTQLDAEIVPSGLDGANLIVQVRNAVSAMRAAASLSD
jgi:hypothetical protein